MKIFNKNKELLLIRIGNRKTIKVKPNSISESISFYDFNKSTIKFILKNFPVIFEGPLDKNRFDRLGIPYVLYKEDVLLNKVSFVEDVKVELKSKVEEEKEESPVLLSEKPLKKQSRDFKKSNKNSKKPETQKFFNESLTELLKINEEETSNNKEHLID